MRTLQEWMALRGKAVHHLRLAVRVMRWQDSQGLTGTFEQPPRCVSWRLRCVQALLELPRWERYTWPSCVYGHRDPGSGRPFLKRQGFASNVNLAPMRARCSCGKGRHQVVQGVVESGERAGQRRSSVSGEYPPRMCEKIARLIQQ